MRIDLLITELDLGGAERCCASLAEYLHARDHRVRLIAIGPRPAPDRIQLVQRLESLGVEMHFLGGASAMQLPKVWWRLRALVKRDQPDVAQSFLWHANVLAASVYPGFSVPFVGGMRVVEPRRSRLRLGRWAIRKMAAAVCVSRAVAKWCEAEEYLPSNKRHVIPNGIDVDRVPKPIDDRATVPNGVRILLFVGRFEAQKGVDVLLRTAPRLLQQLPEHHLVLIGDGNMKPDWGRFRESSPDRGRIHLLGRRSDVRDWMNEAELFLLPARYEGMPNVVLEAMAASLPICVTRVEGVPELLGDATAEQSVERDAWDDWQSLVVRLARDATLRKSLGAANRARCEREFRIENVMAQYEQLLLSIQNLPTPKN